MDKIIVRDVVEILDLAELKIHSGLLKDDPYLGRCEVWQVDDINAAGLCFLRGLRGANCATTLISNLTLAKKQHIEVGDLVIVLGKEDLYCSPGIRARFSIPRKEALWYVMEKVDEDLYLIKNTENNSTYYTSSNNLYRGFPVYERDDQDEDGGPDKEPSRLNEIIQPQHYKVMDTIEALEVIKSVLSPEEFKGFCLGNILKYRLRAGKKGNAIEDLRKAHTYEKIYDEYNS